MKISLLSGSVVLAGVMAASAALAADLPARRGPVLAPALTPVFNWTGFYVGLNAGYAVTDNKASTIGTPGFLGFVPVNAPASLRVDRGGFAGGGQIGYNYQFGQGVIGLETDLQYVGTGRTSAFAGPLGVITTAGRDDGYLGTLRARLGFAADRFLVYATGGLAYGAFDTGVAVGTAAGAAGPLWGGSSNTTRFGWTAGAGLEYAITNNWTVKLEGLYYDLGRRTVTAVPLNAAAAGFAGGGVAYQARVANTGTILRAGVNYKF